MRVHRSAEALALLLCFGAAGLTASACAEFLVFTSEADFLATEFVQHTQTFDQSPNRVIVFTLISSPKEPE